jgi:lipid II:glycine glycyltransferase (peptidoglycan interpeptide bridge formation enzyme)
MIKNITQVDPGSCEKAGSFLQSAMWGEFKSRFGWNANAFSIQWGECGESILLVLSRRLTPGFSFTYIPWGPELPKDFPDDRKAQALAELSKKLKPFLAHNTGFIRIEPPWYFTHDNTEALQTEATLLFSNGFRCAAAVVQPPDTVIINLETSCEQLLANMKSKWRYNILLAGKKGVQVEVNDEEKLAEFYSLLQETAERDGIAIHSYEYYKTLFVICKNQNYSSILRLYTAKHEGDILAAIIVLFHGQHATYLYGASSNLKRNLMAAYALQWRAIQDAKEAGCRYYDLFGIPPDENPNHPMAGLYRFKTGFGGQIIHRCGSWDYAYKPLIYTVFRIAEAFRKKLRDLKKKR